MESDICFDLYPMDLLLKRRVLPKSKQAVIETLQDGSVEFRCVECPAKFTEKELLEQHLCDEHNELRHICGICGTGLKRREHLDRHIAEHGEKRPHICPYCGKAFKRKEHLNIHKSIHSGDKNQQCNLCEKSFYRKDHLQKHMQTHNKELVEMQHNGFFIKQEIEELQPEMEELQPEVEELQPVNSDGENANEMEVDEITESRIALEKPFKCDICEKRYKRKDHLKIHSWTHREKEKICTQCGKAFHKDSQLLVHMSTHLNINFETRAPSGDRPHVCAVCSRAFKRRAHLRVHMETHYREVGSVLEPTIWCSRCNEGFHENAQFEVHECVDVKQEQELDISIEDETIVDAPAETKKENEYPAEIDTVSPPPALPPLPCPQRVYVCKFCTKPFKRKDHYKIHLHVHTGIKNFFCSDCGKGFYRKDHLQKHALVHNKPPKINVKKLKKALPELFPISMMMNRKQEVKPEITITASSNTKLRVPFQIKVPYQVVICSENGEQRTVTVDPQAHTSNTDQHTQT